MFKNSNRNAAVLKSHIYNYLAIREKADWVGHFSITKCGERLI